MVGLLFPLPGYLFRLTSLNISWLVSYRLEFLFPPQNWDGPELIAVELVLYSPLRVTDAHVLCAACVITPLRTLFNILALLVLLFNNHGISVPIKTSLEL